MFWGYAARQCIIDNTNLARLRGTGANAVIVPEMEAFAKQYGFAFRCHELKHSQSQGRRRAQLLDGGDQLPARPHLPESGGPQPPGLGVVHRAHGNKPQGKAGLIPAKAFEHERSLPDPVAAPSARALPGPWSRHRPIRLHAPLTPITTGCPAPSATRSRSCEYSDRLKIYQAGQCLAEYPLPADGVSNSQFSPPGQPATARHQPIIASIPPKPEEKHLRALAPAVSAYLDFALPAKGIAAPRVFAPAPGLEPQDERRAVQPEPRARPQIPHHRPGDPRAHRPVVSPTRRRRTASGRKSMKPSASARLIRKAP